MKCAIKTTALLVALSATSLALADITTTSTSGSGAISGSSSTANNAGIGNSTNTNTANSTSNSGSTSGSAALANGNAQNVNVNVGTGGSTAGTASNPEVSNSTTTINNEGTSTIRTNPAIGAPALTTTLTDTCMGSFSLGMSFTGFGATGGATMVDQACVRRLDSREFRAMGLNDVALALLCQSDANRKAVEATGRLCPGTPPRPIAAAPAAPMHQVAVSSAAPVQKDDFNPVKTVVAKDEPNASDVRTTPDVSVPIIQGASGPDLADPVIRYRLGLAPQ